MNVLIDVIAGARPNFVKIAPILRAFDSRRASGSRLRYRLVHTGQHYDTAMSGSFFQQLGIPEPDVNLNVGSSSQASQTAAIMTRYEELLLDQRCQLCLVVGDVTSTMACAIVAQKLNIPVGHVEGGLRSDDWSMPEEINRLVTDSISNWFFTTSEYANSNLRNSGVSKDRIFFVGNTMIDSLLANLDRTREPTVWLERDLQRGDYLVVTLHRPANVDNRPSLLAVLSAIANSAQGRPVIFPIHPRTAAVLGSPAALPGNLALIAPQPYLEFLHLVRHARAVITDSGGLTEEATVLNIPCLTLRNTTERPETVEVGTNELVGTDPQNIALNLDRVFSGDWKTGRAPEKWDGEAAERIVSAIEKLLNSAVTSSGAGNPVVSY